MRARLALVVAVVVVMSGIAAAPIGGSAGVDNSAPWSGNPLAAVVYAQGPEPVQEPVQEPEPVEQEPEPAESPEEPAPVEEPAPASEPEPQVTPEPAPVEQEPEVAEQPAEEPEAEAEPMGLSDYWSQLQAAITAEASHAVTVAAATEALEVARRALAEAEEAHAAAMEGQGGHGAGTRAAAEALVDFLTAEYLPEQ